jgi:hypothetical protein
MEPKRLLLLKRVERNTASHCDGLKKKTCGKKKLLIGEFGPKC